MAHHYGNTDDVAWPNEQSWTMTTESGAHGQAGSLMFTNQELLDLSLEDTTFLQRAVETDMPLFSTQHMSMDTNAYQSQANTTVAQEESDCSWTETDSHDLWYDHLRQQLHDFRQGPGCTLTTIALDSRRRKQVHSMANMWGLSHMSVGTGKQKRVLLSKCALAKTGEVNDRRWNPARESWLPGYIDPRLVLFHWISSTICFQTCLNVLQLPTPARTTMDVQGDYGTVYALFENASDAATTLLALNASRPHWNMNTVDQNVEACYLRLPSGFSLTSYLLADGFCSLPTLVYQSFTNAQCNNPNLAYSGSVSPSVCLSRPRRTSLAPGTASPTELANALHRISSSPRYYPPLSSSALHSRRGSVSRRLSLSSSLSRDLGYISASSQVDSEYSLATSASKKRRRAPKILGGYPCTVQGCDKAFDHQGELTKHEKVHSDERPYACGHCGKGFAYPKDLRRHEKTHAVESTTVSPILEPSEVDNDFDVEDAELKQRSSMPNSRHAYACANIAGVESVFTLSADSTSGICTYCGKCFPSPPDWGIRSQHLLTCHNFGGCNHSKQFSRADYFRQHLEHSHYSVIGSWTSQLEQAARSDEAQAFSTRTRSLSTRGNRIHHHGAYSETGERQSADGSRQDRPHHAFGGLQRKVAHLFGALKDGSTRS